MLKKFYPVLCFLVAFLMTDRASAQANCVVADTLGTSSNVFSIILNEANPIVANQDLNTILFVHRNDASAFGGHSGQLRYAISTNGGSSWTRNVGLLNPLSVNGTNAARYPQISIYNPAGNTNPNNAYLVYQGATVATTWNGIVTGVRRLNGSGNTETYNQAVGTNTLIPRAQTEGAPGEYWAVDAVYNATTMVISGFRILKGTWNSSTNQVVWAVNTTISPTFFRSPSTVSDFNIAFDPSGQIGWMGALTHVTGGPTDSAYYPVFWHTTNGGSTWSGPETVDIAEYPCLTTNVTATNTPSCGFDADLTVDTLGNPHMLVAAGNGNGAYSMFFASWKGMFDITKVDGVWQMELLGVHNAGRGIYGTGTNDITMDQNPQISRSPDGRKIFYFWADTPGTAGTANTSPNLFGRAMDVIDRNLTPLRNLTACDTATDGRMIHPRTAPVCMYSNGVYSIPAVYARLNSSGSTLDPARFWYLDSLTWADSDFNTAACTSSVSISAPQGTVLCPGDSLMLDAGATPSAYAWSTGESDQTVMISAPGTYGVVVSQGCCIARDSITITLNQNPPVADFDTNRTGLQVAFVDSSSGSVSSWSWDFGDGNSSNSQNPTHTYATAGTYWVCLTVDDGVCTATFCDSVSVACPNFNAGFSVTGSTLTKIFADQSMGSPTSWFWDFGDGDSSNIRNPSHAYAAPGAYTVCLTITSPFCGSTTFCNVVVVSCNPPAANFTAQSNQLAVSFTDGSTGGATSWFWDFGDGNTDTTQNPNHTYASPGGTFNVCLIASSGCGSDTICYLIQAGCSPAVPAFQVSGLMMTKTFTDQTSGQISAWLWDFGDGNTSTMQNPVHIYTVPGLYTVCLTITDTCGQDSSCQVVNAILNGLSQGFATDFELWPNPVSGSSFFVKGQFEYGSLLRVRNVLGQQVWAESLLCSRCQTEVSLPAWLGSGVYFVEVGGSVKRILVQDR